MQILRLLARVCCAALLTTASARAEQNYKPTVGLETESVDIKAARVASNGAVCTVHHAQEMSKTAARSAEVDSLQLMYMNLDGVPKEGGKEGHEELILGPHTARVADRAGLTLADGLAAQRAWFEHSLHFCQQPAHASLKRKVGNRDMVPLEEVLKSFTPPKPAYKMEVIESAYSDNCKWYVQCPGSSVNVDTQVTYTVPLAKMTAPAFGEMPRNGSQGPYVRGSAAAAVAFLEKNARDLKDDAEVRGFFQLFYKFATAVALCMEEDAGSCIKNADGQMVKADLRELFETMKSRPGLQAFWTAHSDAPTRERPWREPKETLVKAMVEEINLTRFPEFRGLTPDQVRGAPPEQIATFFYEDVGFVFRHHLIMVFDNNSSYRSHCSTRANPRDDNDLTTKLQKIYNNDERYQRLLCTRIAVAAETYKPIPADGGALYLIVESRFTGNPFNHAFFPCGTGVSGVGGACTGPVDFARLSGPKAEQWTKLEELQKLPPGMSGGTIPAKVTKEEAIGLIHRDAPVTLPGKPLKKKTIELGPAKK
jgi:hypothetical protein